MKRDWNPDELAEQWTLSFAEHQVVGKKTGATRLGFAVLLKFIQIEGRFPREAREVPQAVVEYIAPQLDLSPGLWGSYAWSGRTVEYHRAQIRRFLGFREVGGRDTAGLAAWLRATVLSQTRELEHVKAALYERCRELRLEPPTPDRVDRLVRSTLHAHEKQFCTAIQRRLSPTTRARLDDLLAPPRDDAALADVALLHFLKADPGRASLESIQEALTKLKLLRATALPQDLFASVAPQVLRAYRHRVAVEEAYELRRHPEALRATLLAARGPEILDDLADLLVGTVHRIESRAERKVDRQLLEDFKRVAGKDNLLFEIADASLAHPDDIVREVVYPIINEETLRALVKEWKASGPRYRQTVQMTIRRSYQAHYRRMMPALIEALPMRSSNERHRPVMRAIELVRRHLGNKSRFYPADEDVPIEGVVKAAWRDAVVDVDPDGAKRVNRITYEVCALSALREKLRCKEIWVAGANRYRNPDEDLPRDFASAREAHYGALKLPMSAQQFVEKVREEMKQALGVLDSELPRNPDVRILSRAGGRISLSPTCRPGEIATSTHSRTESLPSACRATVAPGNVPERFRQPRPGRRKPGFLFRCYPDPEPGRDRESSAWRRARSRTIQGRPRRSRSRRRISSPIASAMARRASAACSASRPTASRRASPARSSSSESRLRAAHRRSLKARCSGVSRAAPQRSQRSARRAWSASHAEQRTKGCSPSSARSSARPLPSGSRKRSVAEGGTGLAPSVSAGPISTASKRPRAARPPEGDASLRGRSRWRNRRSGLATINRRRGAARRRPACASCTSRGRARSPPAWWWRAGTTPSRRARRAAAPGRSAPRRRRRAPRPPPARSPRR